MTKPMRPPTQGLPLPAIPADSQSMELLRIWLIDGAPHFVITPHRWEDPAAWGLLLADVMQHLGNAYESDGKDKTETLRRIKAAFDAEWDVPTTTADVP